MILELFVQIEPKLEIVSEIVPNEQPNFPVDSLISKLTINDRSDIKNSARVAKPIENVSRKEFRRVTQSNAFVSPAKPNLDFIHEKPRREINDNVRDKKVV